MKTKFHFILNKMWEHLMVSFGIIALILISGSNVQAQKKLYLSTGVGYPELMNVAMGFKLGITKLGVHFGTIESSTSVSGDISFMSAREEPMFFKMGVSKLERESESSADKYIYLNLRIGKEWKINNSFGVAFDGGMSFVLIHDEIRKTPNNKMNSLFSLNFGGPENFPFPTASLMIFYRI